MNSKVVRTALTIVAFFALAVASHALFLPQFFGVESAVFTYFGGDSTTQLIPSISLLERNILAGNLFWSWEYGLGGDLYSEFSYYYSTSPFFYLQFAIKALFGVAGGDFYSTQLWRLIFSIVKETLCMVLLYALLKQERKSDFSASIAAIVYGCSFWFIDNSFAFDFMTDAMIWPPLVIMAFNHYEKTRSWLPLCVAVAFSFANSFYFGYINCLFYLVFALVFLYQKLPGKTSRSILIYVKKLGRLTGIVIVSILLAAVAFFPSVMAFLNADRTPIPSSFTLLPSLEFLKILPEILFFKGGSFFAAESQTYALPLVVLLVFFIDFKKVDTPTKRKTILAVTFLILWMIPAISSVMNGFSYLSNRWCYLIFFVIAYALPNWLEALIAQKRIRVCALGGIGVVLAVCIATHDYRVLDASSAGSYYFPPICVSDLLFFFLQFAFIACLFFLQKTTIPHRIKLLKGAALTAFICATLIAMPYGPYALTSGFRNNVGIGTTQDSQELNQLFEGDEATQQAYRTLNVPPDEFFRTNDEETSRNFNDNGFEERFENRSWLLGTYPVSAYNSLISKDISRWLKIDHCVTPTTKTASYYQGFGHRLFLENAWGVRYKFNTNKTSNTYGYQPSSFQGTDILENTYANGIDLWYDSSAPSSSYDSWSYAEKDAALLQTAAIDDPAALPHLPQASIDLRETIQTIDLANSNITFSNCSFADGTLVADHDDAAITIPLSAQTDAGEYLLSFTATKQDGTSFLMSVNGEQYWSPAHDFRWGYPTDTYAFCPPEASGKITVGISEGSYTVSNAKLQFSSYRNLEQWTDQRNLYNLENLSITNNKIKGTINNQSVGILSLSVPYNRGWTCIVDGKAQDTISVHDIFTGIYLEPGDHTVELTYTNQSFNTGALISLVTGLCIGATSCFSAWRRKRNPPAPPTGKLTASNS